MQPNQKGTHQSTFFRFPMLSRKEAVVLELLLTLQRELFGLEMVEESNGMLKRGTIYVTLQRMQEKGFIDSRLEVRSAPEIGIPRRLYKVTGHGQQVFDAFHTARQMLVPAISAAGG